MGISLLRFLRAALHGMGVAEAMETPAAKPATGKSADHPPQTCYIPALGAVLIQIT